MPTMGSKVKDPNGQEWVQVMDGDKVSGYIPSAGGAMVSQLPAKKADEKAVFQGTKAYDPRWNPNTQRVEDFGGAAGQAPPPGSVSPPSSQDALQALIAARNKKKQQQSQDAGAPAPSSTDQQGPAANQPVPPSGDNYNY